MNKAVLTVVVASAIFILAGCDRLFEPTRPTPLSSPSLQSPEIGLGTINAPVPAVEWNCIALAAVTQGLGNCPARTQAASPTASATSPPAAPLNLVGTVSGSRVALSWNVPFAGDAAVSYVLEAGSASGRADLANFDTGVAAPAFTADNVPAGTYYVRVRGKNAVGVSAPSNELVLNVTGAGCAGPPSAPTNLRNTITGSTVVLTWNAPVGGCAPTSYVIQAGSVAGSSNVADFDNRSVATSFTASGVEAGQYYVRIRGVTASGVGSASNEVVIAVLQSPLTATTFVAFGDSITEGESGLQPAVDTGRMIAPSRFHATVLLPVGQRYPTILQQDLVARYRTQMPSVANEGQGGEAAADPATLSRLITLLSSGRFSVVLIMEGSNDLTSRDSLAIPRAIAGLRQMLREAKGRAVRPYLATIPPMNPQGLRGGSWDLVPAFNDNVRALAVSEGVTLVDVFQGFNNNLALLGVDGLHPTVDGYTKIADVFYTAIKATLERSSPVPAGAASSFIGRFR
jgi:lysophospholipase L1-like esterase